jgi:hypothetical protein
MAGPAPENLPDEEWLKVRARFLAGDYGVDADDCLRDLIGQQKALERFRDHEEVVLWFEHDLFCQINLIYLLDWFGRRQPGVTRLSMVCVGEFNGVTDFRGLGQLSLQQMLSLFDRRREVTVAQLDLAAEAWRAYRFPTPEAIERLAGEESSALEFLRAALLRHLARLPSTKNGVGRIENRALELIAEGHTSFRSLFQEFGNAEAGYGLGDSQFWSDLKRLGAAGEPLVIIRGVGDLAKAFEGDRYHDASFELTDRGLDALAGRADFIEANGIDIWLGGAHLTEDNLWRWDDLNGKLVRSPVT